MIRKLAGAWLALFGFLFLGFIGHAVFLAEEPSSWAEAPFWPAVFGAVCLFLGLKWLST